MVIRKCYTTINDGVTEKSTQVCNCETVQRAT